MGFCCSTLRSENARELLLQNGGKVSTYEQENNWVVEEPLQLSDAKATTPLMGDADFTTCMARGST